MTASRLVPLIHTAVSLALFTLSETIPHHGSLSALSYGTALLFFLVNLPGVFLIQFLYTANVAGTSLDKTPAVAGMIAITSSLLFLITWLLGKMLRRKPL